MSPQFWVPQYSGKTSVLENEDTILICNQKKTINHAYMEARALGVVPEESKLNFFHTIELSTKYLKEGL
jgi:hypothetical protein